MCIYSNEPCLFSSGSVSMGPSSSESRVIWRVPNPESSFEGGITVSANSTGAGAGSVVDCSSDSTGWTKTD